MKFIMLIQTAEAALAGASREEVERSIAPYRAYFENLRARGKVVDMLRLRPSAEGTRVSVREGRRTVVDGPFIEAKEVLGGFAVLEVSSREEAIELAAACPGAAEGFVELRTFIEG